MSTQIYRAILLFGFGALLTSLTIVCVATIITNIPFVLAPSLSVLNAPSTYSEMI
jgi:hypothetical protein